MKANRKLLIFGVALLIIGIPLALCVNYLLGFSFILGIILLIIFGLDLIKEKSSEESQNANIFLYKISLIIPILGIIAGVILFTSEDENKKNDGKICMIFSLVPISVCAAACSIIFHLSSMILTLK